MPEQQTRLLAERYELVTPLGRGTMGTVWRARDRALGREVAVKEIRQDPGLTEEQRAELRERMVREGRIAARISHPSVASIHDVLIQDNSPWIIMELIEARSLEQVIEQDGPLPPRLVAEIGVDLLGALRAAHAQGITHRDVKPGNVLITESGRVVLTDFGIAKAEGDSRLTKTGMVIGSPGYTAPERARGEYTGPESDIWSLGATLYFAVEGRPAYERSTIAETLAALLTESADPPTQAGQLRPVLNGLLNKDYRQRLSAAKAETLLRMVADTPTSEMPVLTAEALMAQEAALPDPFATPENPAPGGRGPSGQPPYGPPGQGPGAPGQRPGGPPARGPVPAGASGVGHAMQGMSGPQAPTGPNAFSGPPGAHNTPPGQRPTGAPGAQGPQGPASGPGAPTGPQPAPQRGGPSGPQPVPGPGGPAGQRPAAGPGGPSGPQPVPGPGGPAGQRPAAGPGGPSGPQPASGPGGPAGQRPASGPGGPSGQRPASGPGGPSGPHAAGPHAAGSQAHGPNAPTVPQAAAGRPQTQPPFATPAPDAGGPAGPEGDYDPERTVSISRPKGPFPAAPEQGGRPQRPADESSFATTRIPKGSPGQQVYPVPAPPPGQPQPQPQPQPGPQQPMPQQGPQGRQFGGHGLGTDLFAIAGPPEEKGPAGNRNGMLVLMAVAAAAAVVIAVLIVALFST